MTSYIKNNIPPVRNQLIVASVFGSGMMLFHAYDNNAAAIIASDGFSQTLKNTMRCIEGVQDKCMILGLGVGAAFAVDRGIEFFEKSSLDLTTMSIGCVVKIFDRELNLYLAGSKMKDAEGKKKKIEHSQTFLMSVVGVVAGIVFLANKMRTSPILIDAVLAAFFTAVKNATKKVSPLYSWSALGAVIVVAMIIDSFRSQSLISKNGVTGLALGLFCKEVMRFVEKVQMGSYSGDDDDEPICVEGDKESASFIQLDSEAQLPLNNVNKKKKKKEKNNIFVDVPPAPMSQQLLLTVGTLSLGLAAQRTPKLIHPVLQSLVIKAGVRFFNNIMRQYSFSKTSPVILASSAVLLMTGSVINIKDRGNSLSKTLFSIGIGLPFGELKAWQLGKKIVTTPDEEKDGSNLTGSAAL